MVYGLAGLSRANRGSYKIRIGYTRQQNGADELDDKPGCKERMRYYLDAEANKTAPSEKQGKSCDDNNTADNFAGAALAVETVSAAYPLADWDREAGQQSKTHVS